MPLQIDLGSGAALELITDGDLAKFLKAGLNSVVHLGSLPAGLLSAPIAQAPVTALGTGFKFTHGPSWTVPQGVGITLSVAPEATCRLTLTKPGQPLFGDTDVPAPTDRHYIGIELQCSVAVDGGAKWSSGNLGVCGDVSVTDRFRVANFACVDPNATVREAIQSAFSRFVLPFHATSIDRLPDGDYLDFDFVGKLALGFGVTYGFSGVFLGGRSSGEVKQSFSSPVGAAVVSATPSFKAGAGFKVEYMHSDAFRVVAGRVKNAAANGATLYLLRKEASGFSTTESLGITLSAGVKFKADPGVLKSEIQEGTRRLLRGAAGASLGNRIAAAADAAVGEMNNAVNALLARGNGQKIALELMQARARENTALFIYNFDFNHGTDGYDCAMRGDYARAITVTGVELDSRSFVERLYTERAGLNLQFFDVLGYHDVTEYIQKTTVTYVGARTFQIRDTVGKKSVSGLFGKEREADLYFIGQRESAAESSDVSGLTVRLNAVFIDRDNTDAFTQTAQTLTALGVTDAAQIVQAYVAHNPQGPVQFTLDIDVALLARLTSTDYLPGGKPPKEPHQQDKRNYEEFVRAVRAVIGAPDTVAQTFETSFARYEDWLAFNRAVTDEPGSTNPGDRLSVGNANGEKWPTGHPPQDATGRRQVQTYILAGQHFMNFCDGVKRLASALPGIATEDEYELLLESIQGMIRKETPFPTFFLKPGMVALTRLADIALAVEGTLPDASTTGRFAIALRPAMAAAAAGLPGAGR